MADAPESRLRDIFVLGTGFLLLFSAFAVVQNLASSLLPTDVAFWTLGSLYISLALGNFLASWMVARFGLRTAILLGSMTFHVFVGANIFVLDKTPTVQLAVLLPAALMLGVGTSVLWNSQGSYLTRCSPGARLTVHTGVFYFLFMLSGVFGNVLAGLLFASLSATYVYCVLLGVGVAGSLLLLMLRNAPKHDAPDAVRGSFSSAASISKQGSMSINSEAPSRRESDASALVAFQAPPAARQNYDSIVAIYGLDDPAGETGASVAAPPAPVAPAGRLAPLPRAARPPHIRSYSAPLTGSRHRSSLFAAAAGYPLVSLATRRTMSWGSFDDSGESQTWLNLLFEVVRTVTSVKALLLMMLVWFYGVSQAFLFGSLPLYIQGESSHKLFLMAVVAGVDAVFSLLLSRVADRIGRRWVLLLGGAAGVVAMLLLTLLDSVNNMGVLFGVALLYGVSDAALQTTISVVVASVFADSTVAGFAAFNLFESVATSVAFFCSNLLLVAGPGGPLPKMTLWLPLSGSLYVGGIVCLFILHRFVFSVEYGGDVRLSLSDVENQHSPSPTVSVSVEKTPLLA